MDIFFFLEDVIHNSVLVAGEGRRLLPVISGLGELSWCDGAWGLGESIEGTTDNKMSWAFKQLPRKLDYVDYKNEKSEFCKTQVLLKAKLLLDLSFAESYSCNEKAVF